MTTLIYKFVDFPHFRRLKLTSLTQGVGDDVVIKFPDFKRGELRLADRSYRLKGGEVKLKLSQLPQGALSVKLITDTRIFSLSGLEVSEGKLLSRETLEAELIALRESVCRLITHMDEVEERIKRLEGMLGNEQTFKLN